MHTHRHTHIRTRMRPCMPSHKGIRSSLSDSHAAKQRFSSLPSLEYTHVCKARRSLARTLYYYVLLLFLSIYHGPSKDTFTLHCYVVFVYIPWSIRGYIYITFLSVFFLSIYHGPSKDTFTLHCYVVFVFINLPRSIQGHIFLLFLSI
jgi:hypothetical protein